MCTGHGERLLSLSFVYSWLMSWPSRSRTLRLVTAGSKGTESKWWEPLFYPPLPVNVLCWCECHFVIWHWTFMLCCITHWVFHPQVSSPAGSTIPTVVGRSVVPCLDSSRDSTSPTEQNQNGATAAAKRPHSPTQDGSPKRIRDTADLVRRGSGPGWICPGLSSTSRLNPVKCFVD